MNPFDQWNNQPDRATAKYNVERWTVAPKKKTEKPKGKVSGRGGTPTSFISEGGGLAGAAAGAAIGSILPGIGTGIGALIGGGIGAFGGRLAENKVRDDRWGIKDSFVEGGLNALPIGTVAGKGAKGLKAAKAAGHVWDDDIEKAAMFEFDDSKAVVNRAALKNPVSMSSGELKELGELYSQYEAKTISPENRVRMGQLMQLSSDTVTQPKPKLKDVWQHPELYKQYPHMAEYDVVPDLGDANQWGHWDSNSKAIHINPDLPDDALKGVFRHEGQHAVDEFEGWSRGTSPEVAGSFDNYLKNAGEARGRATEARGDMPMSERYKLPGDVLSTRARKHTKLEDYIQDLNDSGEPVLFHGGAPDDELRNNQFFGDFYQHAAQYADGWDVPGKVHAVKYDPKDVMYFNSRVVDDLKNAYGYMPDKELKKIYSEALKEGRLMDAQFQGEIDDNAVVPYIKKFLQGGEQHESSKVHNDLIAPLMQHYAKQNGNKHIVGFEGDSYMGADEYIVGDLSRTTNLDDIFKNAKKPRSTFYDSLDVPKEDLIVRPAGVQGGTSMFVRRPDKPTELMAEDNAKRFNPDGTLKANAPTTPEPPAPKVFRDGGDTYRENGTELVARERFNIPALKKISSGGSDRDVYDLGDGHVLKVSKTARGLAQNDAEVDYFAQESGLIPSTKEAGKNYVVSVKVNPPDKATKAMVAEMKDKFGYSDFEKHSPELQEFLEKHGLSDIMNYDIMSGDYTAIRNWGTTVDGKPIHLDGGTLNKSILHDKMKYQQYKSNGYSTAEFKSNYPNATAYKKNLDDPDFREVYNQSRAAKKKYGDMDKATMYGIAGLLGGGSIAAGMAAPPKEERWQIKKS